MEEKEVIYYEDELNDEFSGTKIDSKIIDEKFKYKKSIIWELFSSIIQNFLSMPIKVLYLKFKFNHKFIGKEKIKQYKKDGLFIYANHTQNFADTFIPSLAIYPKRNFLIVNPENISLKGTGWLVELLGAIPIPSTINASKKFLEQIELRVNKKQSITVYPEAHIWPYYTKIRNFKSVSFRYPVEFNKPAFSITNTYKKEKNKIKMISYIDGPFYPDATDEKGNELSKKDKIQNLRDKIYNSMVENSKNNTYEKIIYKKKTKVEE